MCAPSLGVYAMNMKKSFVSAAVAVLGLCGMVAPAYSQMEGGDEIEPQVVLVEVTAQGEATTGTAELLGAAASLGTPVALVVTALLPTLYCSTRLPILSN